ncbi:MAG: CpsD/CapB family tyrosine-protein kinase [Candidatus Eisenbacteria bacterium]|uniref:CpsD/CapB family tyrosine-protein kinase n=1 Tax=Eiseniibacteriota bacterium TaxID=2212470 RepID=A0A849SQI6_UNCEI|nr:CpsD/CapB family tyrosine-protein kinase [Candidatus Eisenbacteria bacterium]
MSRIFEALRKATHLSPATAPAVTPEPPRPATSAARSAAAPARSARVIGALPRPISVPVRRLDDGLVREVAPLRIHLEAALTDRSPRVVAFTCSQPGEGTSSVAADFATLIATEGRQRVILVDLHARRPMLETRLFGSDSESRAPLSSEGSLALVPMDAEHRAAGYVPSDWAEALIESLAPRADWILLDCPPVLESPEAVDLAALADGAVLVVQAGSAKRPVIARSQDLLRKTGARLLGTVLNRRRLEIPAFIYRRI